MLRWNDSEAIRVHDWASCVICGLYGDKTRTDRRTKARTETPCNPSNTLRTYRCTHYILNVSGKPRPHLFLSFSFPHTHTRTRTRTCQPSHTFPLICLCTGSTVSLSLSYSPSLSVLPSIPTQCITLGVPIDWLTCCKIHFPDWSRISQQLCSGALPLCQMTPTSI